MEPNDTTTRYTESLKALKLSASSRARMENALGAYADFHTVPSQDHKETMSQVRDAEAVRSTAQVAHTAVWYTAFFTQTYRTTMPLFALAAVLLIGGGTSLAAQGSLPGELLYPVKVGLNENVRLALAVSSESQTEVELALLEERVREAQALKAEGRLDGELALAVNARIEAQAKAAHESSTESEAVIAVAANTGIDSALARYNTLIGRDDRLTIAALVDGGARIASNESSASRNTGSAQAEATLSISAPYAGKADADAGITTMLSMGPAPLAVLRENAQVHYDALIDIMRRYSSQLSADVSAEFNAKLDEAASLMARVAVQSNEDAARELINEATVLIGEVEAALTLLGEAKVDTETGAIIDIDLSRKPASEPQTIDIAPMPPEVLHYGDGPADSGAGVDSVIDISNDMIDTSTGATGQFGF